MFIHAIGLLLAISIVVHFLTIVYLLRSRVQSFMQTVLIYINSIFLLLAFSSLFLFNQPSALLARTVFNIQLVLQMFIPPALYLLQKNETLGAALPKITYREVSGFILSLVIALLVITNQKISTPQNGAGYFYPKYNNWYFLFVVYFYASVTFVLYQFFMRIKRLLSGKYWAYSHRLFVVALPFLSVGLIFLHAFQFMPFKYPLWLLGYPILTAFVMFLSYKWKILDLDANVSLGVKYIFLSIFLGLFFLLIEKYSLFTLLILLIFFLLLGYFTINWLSQKLQGIIFSGKKELFVPPNTVLEKFSNDLSKFHDVKDLAGYLSNHFLNSTQSSKALVVASKFDFNPFEVLYATGYSESEISTIMGQVLVLDSQMEAVGDFILVNNLRKGRLKKQLKTLPVDYLVILRDEEKLLGYILLGEKGTNSLSVDHYEILTTYAQRAGKAFKQVQFLEKIIQDNKMAELGMVASQLAHDFQSFISLVKLDVSPDSRLRQQAVYMEKLVQDLLNYARPQNLRLAPENINQLIDMSLDLLQIPPNISIEKNYDDALPELNLDGNQLRRVFQNLLKNSVRSMGENSGRIKISTRPLRPLSPEQKNTWIYIEILDEGCGIPDEFFSKIFEPFFTTYKHQGGNGMGLAMVRQIITRHKGFVDVTSKQGKGTIFNIRLPYIVEVNNE